MSAVTTMTSKGQMTIPKEIREQLALHAGTRCDVSVVDGSVVLTPRRLRIADLAGFLGNPLGRALTVGEMDDAIAEAVADDDERIKREWNEARDDRS
ncbi:AbrB/MazE/SpoVT family DNA-binding domain-containing protein [Jiella sp. M17.18]|uniref:AbrB/MazE/SpoVT family DNA-binding domain-containing protein n=1 Tax=Jiella sp. M17.18 TaxID=3234247 RepID=UPI0034DF19A6